MGLFDGMNNPWAPGGRMSSRLPWAQPGLDFGWGHGNEFFTTKTQEQMYTNTTARVLEGHLTAGPLTTTLGSIEYDRFSNDAVVEFHGCRVGADVNTAWAPVLADNIAENFSEGLYEAGSQNAVVIAHVTKANPNINGEGHTAASEQDYRHGQRVIYHNGYVLFRTSKKRHIGKDIILSYLEKKKNEGDDYDGDNEKY